tara:strand:+ start:19931 stop:20866 length:936 start_codon:yes stop_codon:yes gene_type:complete
MLNILYCLDENYNYQALTSIISVLDSSTEKLNIFIIHKNPKSLNNLPNKIIEHSNLNDIKIIKFEAKNKYFPNIENTHISEATYYRLYIENLLPNNIDQVLYLDCDVICINDPIEAISNLSKKTKESKNIIAVKTEFVKDNENREFFENLNSNLKRYFNAGVMYIDLKRWRKFNVEKKSLKIIEEKQKDLLYWDQDVLNILFENRYLEIEEKLNFKVGGDRLYTNELTVSNSEIFIHYMGSKKPWTLEGLIDKNSSYYQLNFMKIYQNNYHIVNNWRMYSLFLFIKNTINFKLIKNTKYLVMMKSYIKSLF